MEEILARAVQVFLALAGGYLIVLWFALVVWTYRDIGSRSQSVVTQIFATLLSLLFFVPGALLYMLMRPRTTLDEAFQRSLEEEYLLQDIEETSLCSSCQRQVSDDYVLCPYCQANLKHPCTSCNLLISVGWPVCPFCGSDQSEQALSIRERVEPPEERYLERSARTFRQVAAPTVREVDASRSELTPGYGPELLPGPMPPEETVEPTAQSEPGAPIKLFDRKRTRARKHKSEATSATDNQQTADEDIKRSLDEGVVDDSAVIANFVSNGNGHVSVDSETLPVAVSESDQTENETPTSEEPAAKSSSTR